MISQEQEKHLFNKGYVELPQYKFDGPTKEFENISEKLTKTYNSNTDFHDKYIQKHNIKTILRDQLQKLSKGYLNIDVDKDDIYTISRIVKSFEGLESYRGHFDSHLFTLVTPVVIPKANDSESGQLILFPKIRKEPKLEILNILGKLRYKIFYGNKKGFDNLISKNKHVELDFTNLNPVLFLGRQSFHGNRSFAKLPDGIRITLLTHFFDPNSKGIGSILRKLRNR